MNFLVGLGFILKWGSLLLIPPLIATLIFRGAKKKKGDGGECKNLRMIIIEDFFDIYNFDKNDIDDIMELFGNLITLWFIILVICFFISLLGGAIQFFSIFDSLVQ